MSDSITVKRKTERRARVILILLGLLLPTLSLVPFGSIWLWQQGYLIYWAAAARKNPRSLPPPDPRGDGGTERRRDGARESKASTPPSPLLSARRTSAMYLTEMMSISAQKMSERTPRTLARLTAMPCSP